MGGGDGAEGRERGEEERGERGSRRLGVRWEKEGYREGREERGGVKGGEFDWQGGKLKRLGRGGNVHVAKGKRGHMPDRRASYCSWRRRGGSRSL